MKVERFAAITSGCGIALLGAVACDAGSSAPESSGPPNNVYKVQIQTLTPSGLPACNSKTSGETAIVTSTDTLESCVAGVWVPIPCLVGGAVAFDSGGPAWTAIAGTTGPQGPAGATGPAGADWTRHAVPDRGRGDSGRHRHQRRRGPGAGSTVGAPETLPTGWQLIRGYLVGPGANLSAANLTGVSPHEVNLTDANLTDALLVGATVVSVNWTGATCPDGIPYGYSGENCD
jgi:Pentapeptide repeats (8 copies)